MSQNATRSIAAENARIREDIDCVREYARRRVSQCVARQNWARREMTAKGMSGNKIYTLREASNMLGISEHTIRYYAKLGLFTCPRDENNRRLIDETALRWLRGIRYLRDGGMPISDVKRYCELCRQGDATIAERYEMIVSLEKSAQQNLHDAALAIRFLQRKIAQFETAMAQGAVERDRHGCL